MGLSHCCFSLCQGHPQSGMGFPILFLLLWSFSSAWKQGTWEEICTVVHWQNPNPPRDLASPGCGTSFSFLLQQLIPPLLHLPKFALPNPFTLFPLVLFLNLLPRHTWRDPGFIHPCLSFPSLLLLLSLSLPCSEAAARAVVKGAEAPSKDILHHSVLRI